MSIPGRESATHRNERGDCGHLLCPWSRLHVQLKQRCCSWSRICRTMTAESVFLRTDSETALFGVHREALALLHPRWSPCKSPGVLDTGKDSVRFAETLWAQGSASVRCVTTSESMNGRRGPERRKASRLGTHGLARRSARRLGQVDAGGGAGCPARSRSSAPLRQPPDIHTNASGQRGATPTPIRELISTKPGGADSRDLRGCGVGRHSHPPSRDLGGRDLRWAEAT
jgi:hypothetical protein